MHQLSFFLLKPKAKTLTAIHFSILCDDGRLRKSTGQFVDPDLWENGWFKNVPRNKELLEIRSKVSDTKDRIEKYVYRCQMDHSPILKSDVWALVSNKKIASKTDFFALYEMLITRAREGKLLTRKKKRYSEGSMRIWTLNKSLLRSFAKATRNSLEPAHLSAGTVQQFLNWMNSRKAAAQNYVQLHLRLWANVLDIMRSEGYHKSGIAKDTIFKPSTEKVDKIILEEADVQKIYSLDLSDRPQQQIYRDRWIIMYCTGLRVGDSRRLSLGHFNQDNIIMVNTKTGKKVVIPYHWMLVEILKRYGGNLPPNFDDTVINKEIKKIARDAGLTEKFTFKITRGGKQVEVTKEKWQLLTNHTARRSIVSNMIINGIAHDIGGDMVGMTPQTWSLYNKNTAERKAAKLQEMKMFKRK